MIWRATAEMRIGALTMDQTLTMDAEDFAAAVAKTQRTFQPEGGLVITGVTVATCTATRWDEETCDTPATRTDGYCDDCRETLTDRAIADAEV